MKSISNHSLENYKTCEVEFLKKCIETFRAHGATLFSPNGCKIESEILKETDGIRLLIDSEIIDIEDQYLVHSCYMTISEADPVLLEFLQLCYEHCSAKIQLKMIGCHALLPHHLERVRRLFKLCEYPLVKDFLNALSTDINSGHRKK